MPPRIAYTKEQEILDILEQKYNVGFELFAKAAIDRNSFFNLAREINNNRPNFMTIIYSLMQYDLDTTKKFLN